MVWAKLMNFKICIIMLCIIILELLCQGKEIERGLECRR